jgi:hypothetical protein
MSSTHSNIAARMPSAWIDVSFQNSWVDYGGVEQTIQYRKVGDMTHIRGTAKDGTLSATAFTLPIGYRPPALLDFEVQSGTVEVNAAGEVKLFGASNTQYRCGYIQFSTTA